MTKVLVQLSYIWFVLNKAFCCKRLYDVAKRLPSCHAKFYPDDGHFSLPLDRAEEIFETMREATAP